MTVTKVQGMRYRLYTEYQPGLDSLTAVHFMGATFYDAAGLWMGKSEQSAVIEVIGTADDERKVLALAEDIRTANNQSAVLVTAEPLQTIMVRA